MNGLFADLDTLLVVVFAVGTFISAALMIVLRQPMRVALALITTMLFLGAIYGLLGVHFIAAFQVLIYVGAVMVFMVYVIMLLDVRDPSFVRRYSAMLWAGLTGFVLLVGVLVASVWDALPAMGRATGEAGFSLKEFAVTFLNEYWLHFELTSVLLVAAVIAAIAVIRQSRKDHG